ncbi:MAG TPA: ankyrin repeat domain-containing protein [Streptosporangiaceae bacterium]|nr:ankyrin repeat domain-containing protein [Streptosporangiaceae bacterium]
MTALPAQPHLDHLRREARDLLRAARAGDTTATTRILAVSDRLTLAAAQLAIARDYGFASWAKLKTEVQARVDDMAKLADEFCEASIRDWTGRAERMLAARPELAGYNLATAVVLGDVEKVRNAIAAEPELATRPDPRGWTALHAVCASRWHQLDPARADGLLAVARLLLDAGADPISHPDAAGRSQWTPLRCAVAGVPNPAITQLLLDHGAVPEDSDLYLAGFADDHQCLRMLLDRSADVRAIARMALAAPISANDADGVRLLLEAGADPGQYHDDNGQPCPAISTAVQSDCAAEIVELLLAHGADPALPGPDGRSPLALATGMGRMDLAALLRQHGATDDASDADVFLSACLSADRASAERLLASQRDLLNQLTSEQQAAAMIRAAETGNTEAIRIMLDAGFPVGVRGGEQRSTALHAAAFAGSADITRLLIDRGADVGARDGEWDDTPLGWSVVGSGFSPADNPSADWPATIGVLINAGASLDGITLSPDDPKPPSPAVADLLRLHGVRES